MFIEHFFSMPDTVMLITRPRRMGKSLNMNMLATFLDLKLDSAEAFKGMSIEKSPFYNEHLNKYPVIYLNFREFRKDDYKSALKDLLILTIEKYLPQEKQTTFVS
jgi:hypothetical protein